MGLNLKPKPCPFCGKEPFVFGRRSKDYADGRWAEKEREEFWIKPMCRLGCIFGMTHSRSYGICDGIHFETAEAAVKAWNTRAGDEGDDMTARATIDRLVAEWDSIEKEELEKVIRKLGEMEDEK